MTILQSGLPFTPWGTAETARLPGIQPAEETDAFLPDDAYGAQMALRGRLIRERRDDVLAVAPSAEDPAKELLDRATFHARTMGTFEFGSDSIRRPDGVRVSVDPDDPMATLGHLFQEDYCIHQKMPGDKEHRLTGAVLCFPAQWQLSEKIGRPLGRIHERVDSYDEDLARRVQRLFDTLQPGRALWRSNAHRHFAPDLFTPRSESDTDRPTEFGGTYLRSERQVLFALPNTGAVVFAIHTFMVRVSDLTPQQIASMPERLR